MVVAYSPKRRHLLDYQTTQHDSHVHSHHSGDTKSHTRGFILPTQQIVFTCKRTHKLHSHTLLTTTYCKRVMSSVMQNVNLYRQKSVFKWPTELRNGEISITLFTFLAVVISISLTAGFSCCPVRVRTEQGCHKLKFRLLTLPRYFCNYTHSSRYT
jgi:hypothetical protein